MKTLFNWFFMTLEPLQVLRPNFSSFNRTLGLFLGQKLLPTVGSAHAKIILNFLETFQTNFLNFKTISQFHRLEMCLATQKPHCLVKWVFVFAPVSSGVRSNRFRSSRTDVFLRSQIYGKIFVRKVPLECYQNII